jgi:hypothetical protein
LVDLIAVAANKPILLITNRCRFHHLFFHVVITDTLEPVRNLTRLKLLRVHNNLIVGTFARLTDH